MGWATTTTTIITTRAPPDPQTCLTTNKAITIPLHHKTLMHKNRAMNINHFS
jgi:hypothetical protein